MKFFNYFKSVAAMVAVTLSLSACGGDEDELIDDPGEGEEVFTPIPGTEADPELKDLPALENDEAKAYIENLAKEAISLVKPSDHEELVRLVDNWSERYDDFEAPANWNLDAFDDDDDYYKAPRHNAIKGFMKAVRKAASGNVTAMSRAMSEMLDMARFSGIYEPGSFIDEDGDRVDGWVKKEDSKDIIFRFTDGGQPVEVKGVAEGGTWSQTSNGVTVTIPRTFTATLQKGGRVMVKGVLNSNLDFNAHSLSSNLEASVMNISMKSTVSGNNTKITAHTYAWIDGKQIAHNSAEVNGSNMVDTNSLKNLFREESETWGDYTETWYEFDNAAAGRIFHSGVTESIVLGNLRLKASIRNFGNLLPEFEKYFDRDLFDSQSEGREACQATCNVMNTEMPADLYLQASKNASATVRYQPVLDEDPYGYWWEWYAEPVFVFSDNTTVSFGDYFSVDTFPAVGNSLGNILAVYAGYARYLVDDED